MTIFGRRDHWAIEIEPLSAAPPEADPAAAATWCALRLWAGGRNLAAHTRKDTLTTVDSLHWPAAYLARWFLRGWSGLWERAGWPLPGAVLDADVACSRLDAHLAELDSDADDEQLERRDTFVESHCLLAAAAGGVMPHVYLLREGDMVRVTWNEPRTYGSDIRFLEPQGRVAVAAPEFLDGVAAFLGWCRQTVAARAPSLAAEIDVWHARIDTPEAAEAVLSGYISPWGVPSGRKTLVNLGEVLGLPADWRSGGAHLDPGRFPAAVVFRALAPVLEAGDVQALLARLRSFPCLPEAAKQLDALRSRMVVSWQEAPHQQGYSLAVQVREYLGKPDAPVDVEALLCEVGVGLHEESLSDASVDAATVWDDQHGPVVVLNTLGARNVPWARRMTLAHEFCHLLIDRREAAPLMIASTPWAPPDLERRANAFAAELLLPKAGILRVVGSALKAARLDAADRAKLMDKFQVGETVCSHQLENRLGIVDG